MISRVALLVISVVALLTLWWSIFFYKKYKEYRIKQTVIDFVSKIVEYENNFNQ